MRPFIDAIKKYFFSPEPAQNIKKRKGRSTPDELNRSKAALSQYYRIQFGVEMHPLQSDPSLVPPYEVALRVQAPNKSDTDTFFATGYAQTLDYLRELTEFGFDPNRMEAILDFGMGTGRLLAHYLPFKAKLYGCDVNPTAVDWVQKSLGAHAEIRQTKIDPPLPYGSETFDYVYANSVLTHTSFARHEPWVAELSRVLKKGGCLIASVHNFDKVLAYDAPQGWFERSVEKGLHMNTFFSKEKLLELWKPHFNVLDIRPQRIQTHVIAVKR